MTQTARRWLTGIAWLIGSVLLVWFAESLGFSLVQEAGGFVAATL